jgi:hypothetical protein
MLVFSETTEKERKIVGVADVRYCTLDYKVQRTDITTTQQHRKV